MIDKLISWLFREKQRVQYGDFEVVRGMIAVRDDGCKPTNPSRDISLETSRFYVGRNERDMQYPAWEREGWVWQEVQMRIRRRLE